MPALRAQAAKSLRGSIRVPGDKSVSHRSLMLGALAVGETRITGLLEGADVLATAAAMRALGAEVTRHDDGTWTVAGRGIGALQAPTAVIDMGNAGTGVRLLMGLVATHPITCVFTGDAVASAQVKSAVLLAGLNTPGETSVIEHVATRDHTENMLRHFGAEVITDALPDGGISVRLTGQPELKAADILVPADISSAAFPLVAALLVPDSAVRIEAVGLNPLRAGLVETLIDMGADITIENRRIEGGEPVGDLVARTSALRGIDVPPGRAASMIDEYPVLSVAAALATGTTRMTGIGELRVKESDRLAAMVDGLTACGVVVRSGEDWMEVDGLAGPPKGGAEIAVDLDHRIAMSFLVLGCVTENPVVIDDADAIGTSFPGFVDLMNGLGTQIGATSA